MHAIDTNIVVRYLTADHPEQYARALALIKNHEVFVATTVFLECEWVLRRAYGLSAQQICDALRHFAGLPTVSVESPELLAGALDNVEAGMDFADALHLGAAAQCESMKTFDRKFIQAAKTSAVPVEEP